MICLQSKSVNNEGVLAEFEILYAQLARHKPISSDKLNVLKAKLSDLAHAYCGTPVDLLDFSMHNEHFQVIIFLCSNEQILIKKPDKGSGVVILNKSDYIQKMGNILDVKTNFLNMGSVDQHDNTAKTKQKLQKRLLDLINQIILTCDIYDRIRPTGSPFRLRFNKYKGCYRRFRSGSSVPRWTFQTFLGGRTLWVCGRHSCHCN